MKDPAFIFDLFSIFQTIVVSFGFAVNKTYGYNLAAAVWAKPPTIRRGIFSTKMPAPLKDANASIPTIKGSVKILLTVFFPAPCRRPAFAEC